MKCIPVALGDRSYDVLIASGLLTRAAEYLAPLARGRPLVVVSDENVRPHLATLTTALEAAGLTVRSVVLPPGESTKSWRALEQLTDALLGFGVERGDHVVALGGGVIGDLVGFACAILKRGCGFVQIRRRCWRRSTARSAARPASTPPPARTWSGHSTSPRSCSSTLMCSPPYLRANSAPAMPRW